MVIGNGLIGKAFKSNCLQDVIIFASGVSNSKNLDKVLFEKEWRLLKTVISENSNHKQLVYFSSYSIDDEQEKESLYVKHKLQIEEYIQQNTSSYLIIRTGNIVGHSTNNHTIFNFLLNKIKNAAPFELWLNAVRNFLDIDHLVLMVNELIKKGVMNEICYVLNPVDYKITDIVAAFEKHYKINAHYTPKLKGNQIHTDKTISSALFEELDIQQEHYFIRLIAKYCINENE